MKNTDGAPHIDENFHDSFRAFNSSHVGGTVGSSGSIPILHFQSPMTDPCTVCHMNANIYLQQYTPTVSIYIHQTYMDPMGYRLLCLLMLMVKSRCKTTR